MAYLAACKKTDTAPTPVSIVGPWSLTSITYKQYVNNVLTYDTTGQISGLAAITFGANGFFTEISGSYVFGSAYTFNGNTISIFDTSGMIDRWYTDAIVNLTEHTFSVVDSSRSSDTLAISFQNYTR